MHLEPENIAIVMEILNRLVPDYEVWAFGSRVTGERLKKFSDLDLAIITPSGLDTHTYMQLKDNFSISDLPIRVDIVDFTSASPTFQNIIKEKYEVLKK